MHDVELVVSDLDGTLLTASGDVSAETALELERCAPLVSLAAATGRSNDSAAQRLATVPSIRYIISSNGASTYDRHEDRLLRRCAMSAAEAGSIVEASRSLDSGVGFAWEEDGAFFSDRHYRDLRNQGDNSTSLFGASGSVSSIRGGVQKLMVVHPNLGGKELTDQLKPLLSPELNALYSGFPFCEITPQGATKGEAVAHLAEHLNTSVSKTMAFGDHLNDVTMLEVVGYPVAMGNATPDVQDLVMQTRHGRLTLENDHDGVAVVLKALRKALVEGC